jgi:hypothetical protein
VTPSALRHAFKKLHDFSQRANYTDPATAWFRQQPKQFYFAGFQGLVKQWSKCLNVQADYVEK